MAEIQTGDSIKNKLTLLIMAISVVLLLIVSIVVLAAEVFATRTAMIQEIRMLSAALGTNSRQPLILGQYQETEKLLQALSTQPHIHAAYLFDDRGEPVAEYLSQKDTVFVWKYLEQDFDPANLAHWTSSSAEQINSSFFHLGIFTPIFFDGSRVGALYVLGDLDPLYGRLSGVAFGVLLSLLLLFIFSLFLASRLQKPIIDPLLSLAAVMEKVSTRKDYSVRARKMTNDEIALLVDGLNYMLDEVEEHQRRQSLLQEHLELTVDQRTAELRAAVAELEEARQRADAANEAKSRFLSRMTHELRTPLIGVLGMNGLLQRTALTKKQRALADTVEKSGNDLLALIGDVLDIARIEAGVVDIHTEEVEPALIVEEVVELLAPQAHNKNIELVADIPRSALRCAQGDRARIWQIVMNLVGNAIKFTTQGTIRVRLNLTAEGEAAERFIIVIEDTGIGMDEATCHRVFDPFFQHERTSLQVAHGSGLGLPIVKQLVELMNGKISVASHPGTGSCFTVELPLPLREAAAPASTIDMSNMRTLLGMADSLAATLLERQLRETGADVVRVQSIRDFQSELAVLRQQGTVFKLLLVSREWYLELQDHWDVPAVTNAFEQLAVICQDSAVELSVSRGAWPLYQPVTWKRLHELIIHLQQRQAQLPTSETRAPGEKTAQVSTRSRVVFVGRHAAQRQLLRLGLTPCQVAFECVDDLDDGVALSRSSDVVLMILDTADVTATQLRDLEALKTRLPPCYLLSDHAPENQVIPQFAGCLRKPVSNSALLEILTPLLEQGEYPVCAAMGDPS